MSCTLLLCAIGFLIWPSVIFAEAGDAAIRLGDETMPAIYALERIAARIK